MKTPLALYNLLEDRGRTLVATAGVAFALTLVFMQLGFLGSVVNTATLMTDQLDFDLALVAPGYQHLGDSGTFPILRLYEARADSGVAAAIPFYVGVQVWRCDPAAPTGAATPTTEAELADRIKQRAIMVYGFSDATPPFRSDVSKLLFPIRLTSTDLTQLRNVDSLLIDSRSHESFQPRDTDRTVEVGGRRLRIVGQYDLGTSFAADGSILVSDQTFDRLFPGRSLDLVSLGLIKLRPELADRAEEYAERITKLLTASTQSPRLDRDDIQVLTRSQLGQLETAYWITQKSIGLVFLFGVIVSLIVGVVVVYQVLSSDIMDHFKEYATLKAMGYRNRYLGSVVIQQALLLSVFGYIPALLATLILYEVTWRSVNLPIAMTWERAGMVLVMSSLMCTLAALLSVRKVTASDPANLF